MSRLSTVSADTVLDVSRQTNVSLRSLGSILSWYTGLSLETKVM